jgi:hypothetical protein
MDLKHKKLKQECRKNQYHLTLTFMEGDADGYEYGEVFSPEFEGEIKELYELFQKELKTKNYGSEREEHRHELLEKVLKCYPAITKKALDDLDLDDDDETKCDVLSDYFSDLGYGNYGPCYDYPRLLTNIELTHFDEKGDEYFITDEDRKY